MKDTAACDGDRLHTRIMSIIFNLTKQTSNILKHETILEEIHQASEVERYLNCEHH